MEFAKMVTDPRSCLDRQLHGIMSIRQLLESAAAPVDQFVGITGLTDRLIALVHDDHRPELQFEAARVLTQIASQRPDCVVGKESAVPRLIRYLATSPKDEIKWVAALALGNLAHSSPERCALVVACGVVPPLYACIVKDGANRLMLHRTVPLLVSSLSHRDEEVVIAVLRALCFISRGERFIQAVVGEPGVVSRVVQLLSSPSDVVVQWAIYVFCNCTRDKHASQIVIDRGALACFPPLLTHSNPEIRESAVQVCYNISYHSTQIDALFQAGLIEPIIRNMSATMKEAVWTIMHVTMDGTNAHVESLVEFKVMDVMCDFLECDVVALVGAALESLLKFILAGKAMQFDYELAQNPFLRKLLRTDVVSRVEALVGHSDAKVSERASLMLKALNGGAAV